MPLFLYKCDRCDTEREALFNAEERAEYEAEPHRCYMCFKGVLQPKLGKHGWTPSKWGDSKSRKI